MLSELKQNLEVSADTFVPGWRNLSKNEVIQKYVDTEEQQQKDGYLSAIMCKYWGSINRCYNIKLRNIRNRRERFLNKKKIIHN